MNMKPELQEVETLTHDPKEMPISVLHKALLECKTFPVRVVVGSKITTIMDYPSCVYFRAGMIAACNMFAAEIKAQDEAERDTTGEGG